MRFSRRFARWFPVPGTLFPHASGIDITDGSVKWMTLADRNEELRVSAYGSAPIPAGVVASGAVKDVHALANILKGLKKSLGGPPAAHAALPEEAAYVFSMHVPLKSSRSQIMNMIEFELEGRVPIPPSQAVYDYDTIFSRDDHGEEIAVTVFPKELAEGYAAAFQEAGIELMSLELEARSIGRAISIGINDPVTMLVDCGRARTGIAILKHGIPIFTSTIEIGGDDMNRAVSDSLGLPADQIQLFKNNHGLVADDPGTEKGRVALDKVASSLAEEISRHYRFWDTRRNDGGEPTAPVERVYLLGGSANLRGFPECVAGRVHANTERPNVWRNVASFDSYIPPIDLRTSLQYGTTIGLALRTI